MAVRIDLEAYKRVPFVESDGATIVFFGLSWADASWLMHIRQNPGDTGAALVTLSTAAAGTEGISATLDPAYTYVDPKTKEEVTGVATKVLIQIDESTLEALSLGSPASCPLQLRYDLHVTPSGEPKQLPVHGKFTLHPGVTI